MNEGEERPEEQSPQPERRGPTVEIVGDPAAISKQLDRLADSATAGFGRDPAERAALARAMERMTGGVLEQLRKLDGSPSMKALAASERALGRVALAPPAVQRLPIPRLRSPASSDDVAALKDAVVALHGAVELQGSQSSEQGRWIVKLTWGLVLLTVVIAALTAIIVVLTAVLVARGG